MNVYVGMPGNVVQTRTYGQKEWDPVGGYHNAATGMLAVSDDTTTWPLDSANKAYWPVRDAQGNAVIRSHQDSYGVYRDLTNYLAVSDPAKRLNIVVHQTSFAWNTAFDEDYIILTFELINDTTVAKDSVYFCLYCDFDAGGFESGSEFADDRLVLDLDRQAFWFYDADHWSNQWNGLPWELGVVFLETPSVDSVQLGITDWHYTDNWHEPRNITNDVQQYWLMSSDSRLKNDPLWPDLFHGDNIHIDDPNLIRASGDTLVVFASSGPYHMEPYDTLRFITALVAGADSLDMIRNIDRIWEVFGSGYRIKAVPTPQVTGRAGNGVNQLSWSNAIDRTYLDPETGTNTLAGYYIYKTEDSRRLTWTRYDSVAVQFDATSDFNDNAYTWTDSTVNNGYYYSYSVTTYDSSGAECGKALLAAGLNTVELRPRSDARSDTRKIRAVPNPYIISTSWERERLGNIMDGEPIRELAFVNLPPACTIKVYTIDGDLVKTLRHTNGSGTEYWDLRSDYNQMVATGVYFFYVSSPQGESVGKLAIVR